MPVRPFQIQNGDCVIRVYAFTSILPYIFLEWIARAENLVEKDHGHAFDNEFIDSSNNET